MSKITVDMLNVGKGDSYVIELDNGLGEKFIFVIDGGTMGQSDALISHVQQYHNNQINLAVCTHPDTDHIGGLITLFENCDVEHLFLNDPRDIIPEATLLQRARNNLTSDEVSVFKSAFDRIDELKEQAALQGTTHHQTTFANPQERFEWGGWKVYILGPSESLFKDIWLNEDVVRDWFSSDTVDALVNAQPYSSVLDDPSIDTKPVNNSSIILLIEGYGKKLLFTGDAVVHYNRSDLRSRGNNYADGVQDTFGLLSLVESGLVAIYSKRDRQFLSEIKKATYTTKTEERDRYFLPDGTCFFDIRTVSFRPSFK